MRRRVAVRLGSVVPRDARADRRSREVEPTATSRHRRGNKSTQSPARQDRGVPCRERSVDRAAARARVAIAELGRELHRARLDRSLALRDVARATGMSASQISRIERALGPELGIPQISRLLGAVGLELSIRTYPSGEPIRDVAHARLLAAFKRHLHESLVWRTEVPFPMAGDLRAWDAVVRGRGWSVGVECETRPRDVQALERRLALKERDGGVDHLILLLGDSRHNRTLLREWSGATTHFPVSSARALAALAEGKEPSGNAIVRL